MSQEGWEGGRQPASYLTVATQADEEEQSSYVLEAMYPFSTFTPLAADVDDMQSWFSETHQGSRLKAEAVCQKRRFSAACVYIKVSAPFFLLLLLTHVPHVPQRTRF